MRSRENKTAGVNKRSAQNRTSRSACHSSIWATFAITTYFLLCPILACAQLPVTAGKAKSFDVSLGYSYFIHEDRQSNRVALNGVAASLTIGLSPRLAIRGDFGYAGAGNVLGTRSH